MQRESTPAIRDRRRARALAARDSHPLPDRYGRAVPFDRAAWAAVGIDVPEWRGPTLGETIRAKSAAIRHERGMVEAEAAAHVASLERRRAVAILGGREPDSEIRATADRRADHLGQLIDAWQGQTDAAGLLSWLNATIEPLQARPFAFKGERSPADQLRGFLARARCPMWWRRQLRRAVVRARETEANAAGEVSARARQPYVTDDTLRRHQERRAANAAMMASTELENEAGQVYALAELAAASTSNPAIRRGELMTRINGCERLAEAFGMRGVFLTLTAPSRFHAVHRHGEKNARHDGSTPRDAHAWLCATWAKARARLHRIGVAPFGFRVAEPHHDGCPHWHALLWVKPGQLWRLVLTLRRWWLRDAGDEPGARAHRVKAVLMRPGGASGYVAKYVAKNIDDAGAVGAEGHRDDDSGADGHGSLGRGGAVRGSAESHRSGGADSDRDAGAGIDLGGKHQGELFGGTAARVAAWASAWGIRQFQAIGQPPVTVWRELRRIAADAQGGASPRMARAFEAVNRDGQRRADWALYVIAQGGLHLGRKYLLRLATAEKTVHGRYETREEARPVGVYDSSGPGDWHLSTRSEWRPRGMWPGSERAPGAGAPPWTRVNNCSRPAARPVLIDGRRVDFRALMRRAAAVKIEPGEVQHLKESPPCPPPPKPCPS